MSEMIDQVAKALWESEPVVYAWGPHERHICSWEDAVKRDLAGVRIFRQFAAAAVAAMREPTEAMCDAGLKAMPHIKVGMLHPAVAYEAMIDKALES